MGYLKINTDAAVTAAENIKNLNTQINDSFDNVQSAMNQLDNCWDGSAAEATIGKFNEIKSSFLDSRYNVLDNYVNFLFQQVGEGYVASETVNLSLADQFK